MAALTVATATGLPIPQAAVLTGAAFATSTLPDIDQAKTWGLLDKVIPDEVLGHGGPLDHRGLTHWWAIPLIAYLAASGLTGTLSVAAHGLILGYASHLALDSLWGRPGIPVAPWWWYVGLSFRNDSVSAVIATAVFLVASAWLAVALAFHLPADPRWLFA